MGIENKKKEQLIKELEEARECISILEGKIEEVERREKKIIACEKENRLILDSVSEYITYYNKNLEILFVNKPALVSLGLNLDEIIGLKCSEIFEKFKLGVPVCDPCIVKKAITDGKFHEGVRKSSNSKYWLERVIPVLNEKGDIDSYLEVSFDITQQKKLEETLRFNTYALDHSIDSAFWIDKNAQFIYVNDAACNILGYTKEEVLKMNVHDIDPNFQKEYFDNTWNIIREKGFFQDESLLRKKNGELFPVEITSNHIEFEGIEYHCDFVRDITERKKAEKALRDEAQRRRILVDQSRDGIVVLDENGKVFEANQLYAKILGYTLEEVLDLHVWDWDTQWNKEQLLEKIRTVDESGDHFETRHRRKDGSFLDVEISSNGVIIKGQKLVFCVCRDITKRKKAQKALFESEKKYHNLIENLQEGIWVIDKDAMTTFVNQPMTDMLGYSTEEMMDKHLFDFMNKERIKIAIANLERGKIGIKENLEFEFLHKDSSKVFALLATSPQFDNDGEYCGAIAGILNITELKKAEKIIKESEERLKYILQTTNDGFWDWDLVTNDVYYSPRWKGMLGYKEDEVENHISAWERLVHPIDKEPTMQIVQDYINGKIQKHETEFRMLHKDGYWVDVLARATLIKDQNNKPSRLVGIHIDISERKKIEQALKESEERYRKIIEDQTEIICRFLPDGTYTFINEIYCRFFGKSLEQLIGKKWIPLAHPDDIDMIKANLSTMSKENPIILIENRVFSGKGELRWMEFVNRGFYDEKGNLIEIQSVGRDITEQKLAEFALLDSENRFRELFLHLPNGAIIYEAVDDGKDFTIRDINRAGEGISQTTKDKTVGQLVTEKFPGIKRMGLFEVFQRVWHSGKPEQLLSFLYKDERIIHWADNYVFKLPSNELVAIYRDISKQKRSEEALAESEELFRSIFDSSPIGIELYDSNGKLINLNKACMDILGINDIDQVKGINIFQDPTVKIQIFEKLKYSEQIIFETKYDFEKVKSRKLYETSKSGLLDISAVISNLKGKNPGEIGGYLVLIRDISKRKKAEKDKEKLEMHLLQAQKMESVGTLAGGIAHDFNNILTSIIGNAEFIEILNLPMDDKIKYHLKEILNSGNRAKELVEQILTFSHQTDTKKRPVDLVNIIDESVKMLKAILPSTIEIKINIKSDKTIVYANYTQMHQMLVNLCSNSSDAMLGKDGIIIIEIDSINFDSMDETKKIVLNSGLYVRLSVNDTGCGIDEKDMNRIFDPFYTTKKKKGTGLGLSIVHGIVKDHKGTILVKSGKGIGSEFIVLLPHYKGKTLKSTKRKQITYSTKKAKILFVDDEESIVNIYTMLLEEISYSVVPFTDSVKALEYFRINSQEFDLVITDQTMPYITGFELAKKMLSIRSDIPIILCTGFSEAVTAESARAVGIKEFLMKPYESTVLTKLIKKVMR
jgi:PAS domain S-box-containing protein